MCYSPRSLEACRRQGIDPPELTVKTFADIKELYGDTELDRDGLQMMVEHYEKKRQEKVHVLLKVMTEIRSVLNVNKGKREDNRRRETWKMDSKKIKE